MKPTLEKMNKHFGKYDWDVAYPIQCIEKCFCEGDIFYLKKKDEKAIVLKDDSILISEKQIVTVNEKEETTYGIDKLYFKDIKKVNLKEFGRYGKVLGGHLELTITIDGYEDIVFNSKDDAFESRNGQMVIEDDLRALIMQIFDKVEK